MEGEVFGCIGPRLLPFFFGEGVIRGFGHCWMGLYWRGWRWREIGLLQWG